MLNSTYQYYDGVGNSSVSTGLPLQTIPKSKKTRAWEKETMDRIEEIGVSQITKNHEFRDYYRMVEGRVVKADYQPLPEITRDIVELRNEIELPSYIQHFDLIGIIINQIVGEYDNHQDKIRIDSIDEYAQNDYLREKSRNLKEYLRQQFEIEIQLKLVMTGFPIDQTEFESEEQQQQFLQELEQRRAEIVPPSIIQKNLSKNFKPSIVTWAEHVYEADRKRFSLSLLEKKELKDYLLTGRYFRHWKLGYDNYEPEHWRVEETFFSQDLDIEYPQEGEYVGRVFRLSASDIIQRYGHLLSHNDQVEISKGLSHGKVASDEKYNITNPHKRPVGKTIEPLGYQTLELTEQLQDTFQNPLGEAHYITDTGEEKSVPYWIKGYNNGNGFLAGNRSVDLREDIDVRTDTYQITEAYWRGYERVAFLYYEDDRGIPDMVMVTEDILTDFIKDNNIKQIKTTSIEKFSEDPEINTIAYTYIPKIYQGKKIKGVRTGKEKDVYFDIKPLPFQLKGKGSRLYDLNLPVTGIIGNSFARKIRPYQFGYNVAMNQITNLLEKEIGMFFLMDINFLPSEFKDMGDSSDILTELKQMAKDIGFIPVDFSKKNIQGASASNAGFQAQRISYGEEVQYRIGLAERYKMLALEQIGITPQRMGTPTKGETAEGIRQSVTSSYAQTDNIYAPFNEANRRSTELHLTVAQYSEKSNKDISVFYRKDEGDIATMTFSDDKFHLRDLGVLPISDSKTRKQIEQLRMTLLENNTMGSDMLDYAELFTADTMVGLVELGQRSRMQRQQEEESKHNRELELLDREAQNLQQAEQLDYERKEQSKQRDRDTELEKARISALGSAVDNNAEAAHLNFLTKTLDQREKSDQNRIQNEQKTNELNHKQNIDKRTVDLKEKDLALKMKELKVKMEEIKANERIARVNKN